ncbi:MAG: MOSC domain-containing protein [Limisphaerales bacterium]
MSSALNPVLGYVASLHLHPEQSGEAFRKVSSMELVQDKGIVGNPRYFGRRSRSGGFSKRQVSLIEREIISEHAVSLGLECIPPGVVRSNIETQGVDLIALVGKRVRIGTAVLCFYEPRTPCSKMDEICPGLREMMEKDRQGVMAQVVQSGRIAVKDAISLAEDGSAAK